MTTYQHLFSYSLKTYIGMLDLLPEEEWEKLASNMVDSIVPPSDHIDVLTNQLLLESAKYLRAKFDPIYREDAVG